MNKYDKQLQEQRELKERFNAGKTEEQKESIKCLVDAFIANKGLNKEQFNKLLKYYFEIDVMDKLTLDTYNALDFTKLRRAAPEQLFLIDKVLKACFIINY